MKKKYFVTIFLLLMFVMFVPRSVKACDYYNQNGEHCWYCTRKATIYKRGKLKCNECGKIKYFSWKYTGLDDDDYYKWDYCKDELFYSYDINYHSIVYKSSNKVTVKLHKPSKGCVLKVKIGSKTFTKKVTTNSRKVTVKVKHLSYGKHISVKLYYKGKIVGKDRCSDHYDLYCNDHIYDHVLYGKHIKKGMSKNQLKYTKFWGDYESRGSSSGGWSYWYYTNGSYVKFRHGKVVSWYRASDSYYECPAIY